MASSPSPLKKHKEDAHNEALAPVFAARASLPMEIWGAMLAPIERFVLQKDEPGVSALQEFFKEKAEALGVDVAEGHWRLAQVAMKVLSTTWFQNHNPWEKDPKLNVEEQFCLLHGVHHAWLSEDDAAMEWAMDMCLDVEKMYWWLCAARGKDDLEQVVEDLNRLPGIKLMASLVRLSKRAINRDPRQWAGQVVGRLGKMDLTRHALMAGVRRLLGKRPRRLIVLVPKDEISGLELAGGTVIDVLHINGVNSVTYSPDSLRLASGSFDNTIRIWDAQLGKVLHVLEGHTNWVMSVAYSPDGLRLASVSRDETVRIWDTRTGLSVSELMGHTDFVTSVAYSPDGLRLAFASEDKMVHIWDANLGQVLQVLWGHTSSVNSVAFSPDNHHVASGSRDQTVRIWDTQTGKTLHVLKGHTSYVKSVAYSPDGLRLASGSYDGTARIWDTLTGEMLKVLEGHTRDIMSVAYSPDGLRLASGSDDTTMRIWDTQTGHMLRMWEGHTREVRSVAYSPDGLRLASASWDETVRVWDAQALDMGENVFLPTLPPLSNRDSESRNFEIDECNVIGEEDVVSFTFDNKLDDLRQDGKKLFVVFDNGVYVALAFVGG